MEALSAVIDTSVLLRAENGDVQALDSLQQLVTGDVLWGVAAITGLRGALQGLGAE